MCCITLALNHPHYLLILASNRDEVLRRPTLPLAFHSFAPPEEHDDQPSSYPQTSVTSDAAPSPSRAPSNRPYLSGRDVLTGDGGTWLGLRADRGRLAFLTNFSETTRVLPPRGANAGSGESSRGELVKDWLVGIDDGGTPEAGQNRAEAATSSRGLDAFLQERSRRLDRYAGFNVVVGQISSDAHSIQLGYLTNRGRRPGVVKRLDDPADAGAQSRLRTLTVSNATLDEEDAYEDREWPKVCESRGKLAELLEQRLARHEGETEAWTEEDEDALIESLFEMLGHSARPVVKGRADVEANVCVPPFVLQQPTPAPPPASSLSNGHAECATNSTRPTATAGAGAATTTPAQSTTAVRTASGGAATGASAVSYHSSTSQSGDNSAKAEPVPLNWYATRTSTVLLVRRPKPASGAVGDVSGTTTPASSSTTAVMVERDVHRLDQDDGGDCDCDCDDEHDGAEAKKGQGNGNDGRRGRREDEAGKGVVPRRVRVEEARRTQRRFDVVLQGGRVAPVAAA